MRATLNALLDALIKANGGPYIGPRGGKWADPAHTIPWKDPVNRPIVGNGLDDALLTLRMMLGTFVASGPEFDHDELARLTKRLEARGVSVTIGGTATVRLDRASAAGGQVREAAFLPIPGSAGEILWRERPSRIAVFEETFHAAQHRARGFRKPSRLDIAQDEVEAQQVLLQFGRTHGWTERELVELRWAIMYWRREVRRERARV